MGGSKPAEVCKLVKMSISKNHRSPPLNYKPSWLALCLGALFFSDCAYQVALWTYASQKPDLHAILLHTESPLTESADQETSHTRT